ncbi:MAG: CHC2 zinc finger domain-containing protein, partial [Bacteroidota bacterium]
MIPQTTVQEILETAKIEEVVGDFVNLKRRGVNLIGLCPFHNEKTPSFTVSPTKNICKCFGCGKGGSPAQFLMEHENFTFPEALRYLAKKYNIEIVEKELSPEARQAIMHQDSLFIVNQFAAKFYKEQMQTPTGKSVAMSYFKERGFREATIEKFDLGFAPAAKDLLTSNAVSQGYNIDLLRQLGLTTKYDSDFFRDR